jgi:hypothetical protein
MASISISIVDNVRLVAQFGNEFLFALFPACSRP